MKKIICILAVLSLTACGHQPLAGKLSWVGDMYDAQDPCQSQNWPENGGKMNMSIYKRGPYGYPDFCGASGVRVHVNGYTRSDGTYVGSHYRSAPDGTPHNNLSR